MLILIVAASLQYHAISIEMLNIWQGVVWGHTWQLCNAHVYNYKQLEYYLHHVQREGMLSPQWQCGPSQLSTACLLHKS